jgi:hypothetical protein
MRKEIIHLEGPGCHAILECKDWKQGTRIYCPIMDRGLIQYPNRGLKPRAAEFCKDCPNLRAKGQSVLEGKS